MAQTKEKTPTAKSATKADAAPKKKPVAKPRALKADAAKKVKAAKSPQVNPHVESGLNVSRYKGPSSYVNSNVKTKIMLGREVDLAKLTGRAQAGFYALRDCYKASQFEPRGFDNGILRDLVGAGLITVSGGQKQTIDGKEYMLDGASPVKIKITSTGMSYGSAK